MEQHLFNLHISSIYVGLFILLQFVFTMRVVFIRRGERISLGDGGNKTLEQRIRAHANFTEVVPISLIALALLELNGLNDTALHVFGALLVLFRVMHYIAVAEATALIFRFLGMLGTLVVMVSAAITLLSSVLL